MENNTLFGRTTERLHALLSAAIARVQPFTLLVSCVGIYLAYLTGIYATGSIHSSSRWMGAMLSCTSLITVMQMPTYKESLRPSVMRVVGTFLGALIAYIYLRMLPFSVVGMLLTVFMLEALCQILNIYNNGRIATITLVIIMLVSQMSPKSDPIVNCSLRFFESAVGVGVGLGLRWTIERWRELRQRLLHLGASSDGSAVDMDTMPLRWGHIKVVMVASLGQLTGGALSTLVGVVLPLMLLLTHRDLSSAMQGVVAATSLVGIMVGSIVIGTLSDRHGYLRYFRLSPAMILLGSVVALFSSGVHSLIVGLLLMGLGVGGGYSLDADYISEIMPRRWRLFMVGVAKASSAIGNVVMAFVCFYILKHWEANDHWSGLFLLISLLATVMLLSSIRFAESPGFLLAHSEREQAERSVRYFLGSDVTIGELGSEVVASRRGRSSWSGMLRGENLRRAILCGVPWACEGFGVYGVGVFLPILVMAVGLGNGGKGVAHLASSVELTGYINLFVTLGFMAGLAVVRRSSHIRQQTLGFLLSAAGLGVLLAAHILHWDKWVMVAGFMIFELFLNAGPHLVSFILPSQVYPVADRGAGAGLAAAMGKAGAVAGVAGVPLLMKWGGVDLALMVTAAVQIAGAAVTAALGRRVVNNEWRHDR